MSEFDKVTHPSGATSSGNLPAYDSIELHFLTRMAERLSLGAKKHGRNNWKLGANDKDYIIERLNHAFLHLKKAIDDISNGRTFTDDDLAGVACNIMFAMEYQRIHQIIPKSNAKECPENQQLS